MVLGLIQCMVDRGHPEYAGLDMDTVRQNAAKIPIGPEIPNGVLAMLDAELDVNEEEEGKASAPGSRFTSEKESAFPSVTVKGVMPDSAMEEGMDINVHDSNALHSISEDLRNTLNGGSVEEGKIRMDIQSGKPCDQFDPAFFLAAYAFLFPYGIGAPDLKRQPRLRRDDKAPRVDFEATWAPALMMRAESQFRRDLTFPFALWNMVHTNLACTCNVHASLGIAHN